MKPKRPADGFLAALGASIRKAREAQGLSQEELGFEADLDRTYVSGVERGVRNPTMRTMRRLAAALRTKVTVLVEQAEALGR